MKFEGRFDVVDGAINAAHEKITPSLFVSYHVLYMCVCSAMYHVEPSEQFVASCAQCSSEAQRWYSMGSSLSLAV